MEEERRERQLRLSSTVLTVFPSVTTANIAAAAPPSSPADRETVSFNLERKQSSFTLATSTPFPSIYLAAAVACLLTRVAGATECPSFSEIDHGTVTYIEAENATGARFSCDPDYGLVGSEFLECLPDGSWNGTAPECKPVVCESLPTIPNGQVTDTGTTVGSKANYVCIKGFRMEGNPERECLGNSTWTGSQPECKRIVCKHPGAPEHGSASPADITDYPTATIITYQCVKGYNVVGSATTACSEEGSWTTPIPTCKVTDCGAPPNISNAVLQYNSTILGESASYECEDGFTSEFETLLVCIATGQWSGSRHSCTEVMPTTSSSSKTATVEMFTVTQDINAATSSPSPDSSFNYTLSPPSSRLPEYQSTSASSSASSDPTSSPDPSTSAPSQSTSYALNSTRVGEGSAQGSATTALHSSLLTKVSDELGTSPTTDSLVTSNSKMTATPIIDSRQTGQTSAENTDTTVVVDTTLASTSIVKTSHPAAPPSSTVMPTTVNSHTTVSQDLTDSQPVTTKLVDYTTTVPMSSSTYMLGIKIGIIFGIVIGALLPIIFIIVCTIILCKRKRSHGAYEVRFSNNAKDDRSIIIGEHAKPANHSNGHVIGNGHDNHVTMWEDGFTSHLPPVENPSKKQLRADTNHKDVIKDPNWNDDTVVHIPTVHGPHERTHALCDFERHAETECPGATNSPKTIQLSNLTAL